MVETTQRTSKVEQMKIAVTGISGQLGRALLRDLPSNGHEVIPIDRTLLNFLKFENSISNLDQYGPDLVINCAAFTQVDSAESNPDQAYAINSVGPIELAKYCKRRKIRLIHISTDSIYSSLTPVFNPTLGTPNPLNVYSKSKLAGEVGIQEEYPERAIIIRTAWLYGPTGAKFVQAIISKGQKNECFDVVNDQYGQPTLTSSLSKFICNLIDSCVTNGIFHFSSKDYVSRFQLARHILALSNLDQDLARAIPTKRSKGVAERPNYSLLDVSPESTNNYEKIPNWESDLQAFFRDYNHPNE